MHTLEQVAAAADKVIARKGEDYVYPVGEKIPHRAYKKIVYKVCAYSYMGNPSCIVGHIVNELDPEAFRQLEEAERRHGPTSAAELMGGGVYLPEDFFDDEALDYLTGVQGDQDEGAPWGVAHRRALRLTV